MRVMRVMFAVMMCCVVGTSSAAAQPDPTTGAEPAPGPAGGPMEEPLADAGEPAPPPDPEPQPEREPPPATPSEPPPTTATEPAPAAAPTAAESSAEPVLRTTETSESWQDKLREFVEVDLVPIGKKVLFALLLFLGGWFLAKFLSWVLFRLLRRTELDDKLAEKLGLNLLMDESKDENRVERAIARAFYYLLMLLVAIAVLQFAGLTEAAKPIQSFVDRITAALPLVGKAVLILVAAYFGGFILQKLITGSLDKMKLDAKFAELSTPQTRREGTDEAEAEAAALEERPFSENAGRVVFWLLMVAGIAGAADALEIGPLEHSMQNAIDRIVQLLPSVAIGALLLIAGIVFGRIARTVVDNVLDSAGFNKLLARIKVDEMFGKTRGSGVVGIVAMAFIVLQASIAALNELELETLSGPLTEMMSRFWEFLPIVAVSVLIVIAGAVAGRVIRKVVESSLRNMGFDKFIDKLGFGDLERGEEVMHPHELVGLITQIAIILVATVQALDNMQLDQWSSYINSFLRYSVTHAVVALVIVAVGLTLGNYVRDLIYSRRRDDDDDTLRWVASFARYAVMVFAFTMAIHHLDVGPNFVLISFSLLFGSLCLALALALGLGSREVAGEIVRKQYERARTEIESRTSDDAAP